jgi:hypothetical protein
MRNLKLALVILAVIFGGVQATHAQQQQKRVVRKYKPYVTPASPIDTRWANAHGPWDFSGLLGLYNPGFGIDARIAYRVLNSILEDVDDSLSVEVGVGFVSATNTYGGQSISTSLLEIPILARWDFRINNTNFIVGPNLGIGILTGASTTVNNVTYTTGPGFGILIGGQGMYRFTDHWAGRVNVDFGDYTALTLGATYFL